MENAATIIELTCPLCAAPVRKQVISDYRVVGKDSDQRPRFLGENPLPATICLCRSCGYAGYEPDFDISFEDDDEIALLDNCLANLRRTTLGLDLHAGSGRFKRAAQLAEVRHKTHVEQAELWLQASWCAHFEERDEADQHDLRRHALTHFRKALETGELEADDQQAAVYMIAELYRRVGNEEAASRWFKRLDEFDHKDPSLEALRHGNLRPSQRYGAISS